MKPKNSDKTRSIAPIGPSEVAPLLRRKSDLPASPILLELTNFANLVRKAIGIARREGTRPAVLMIAADSALPIDGSAESLQMRDLLQTIATHLRAQLRDNDVVMQLARQRFGAVLQDVEQVDVGLIQIRLLKVLSTCVADHQEMSLRMGTAEWRGPGKTAEALIREAVEALDNTPLANGCAVPAH